MKLRVGYEILFLPPYFQVVVNLQQKVMPSHPRKLSGLKSQEMNFVSTHPISLINLLLEDKI